MRPTEAHKWIGRVFRRSAALEARAKGAYDLRCVTLEAAFEHGAHQTAEPSAQEIDAGLGSLSETARKQANE